VFYDVAFEELMRSDTVDVEKLRACYAAADEMHDPKNCPVAPENLRSRRGIEVGHVFFFGTKYSESMNAKVMNQEGKEVLVQMGSYGIGVSRLVGAIIEACHDESGIIWPEAVAPFDMAVINIKAGDTACDAASEQLYQKLCALGKEVLFDDRKESAGSKFATQDLIGTPWQIAIGPRGIAAGTYELKCRKTGVKEELSEEGLLQKLS
jgi:prolyl-tRNA synthetase